MPAINFQKTYLLGDEYQNIKRRAAQVLDKYLGYPGFLTFDDQDKHVTYSTEKLIPTTSTHRPRVMLLFSNPHPHSVHQGMFLSPNTRGRENLFWSTMRDAGWITTTEKYTHPRQLADICLKVKYRGPFELIFYCYYAFPTKCPEDIRKIFGTEYFTQTIEPEARIEFRNITQESSIDAVVTFNKGIFNLVSTDQVDRHIHRLIQGELIQSQVNGIDRSIPIFLTYPTGWRYHKEYQQLRKDSLAVIITGIASVLNLPGN